jgi:DNA-binding NtrC family response regulator
MAPILIIEKDAFIGRDMSAFLTQHGQLAECVLDCREADSYLRERGRPDAVVLDPRGEDETTCIEAIRRFLSSSIPVIIWTLLPDVVLFARLNALNLSPVMFKPAATYGEILLAVLQSTPQPEPTRKSLASRDDSTA